MLFRDRLIVADAELVPRRRLPRDAEVHVAPDVRDVLAALGVGLIRPGVRVAGVLVAEERPVALRAGVPDRCVEPELVAHDRTADGRVDVPDPLERVRRRQAQRLQVVVIVARGERVVGPRAEEVAAERIAAVLRDELHPHAAFLLLGADAAGVDENFLIGGHVGGALVAAARADRVDGVAVDHDPRVVDAADENRAGAGARGTHAADAADVGVRDRDAGRQRRHERNAAARRAAPRGFPRRTRAGGSCSGRRRSAFRR